MNPDLLRRRWQNLAPAQRRDGLTVVMAGAQPPGKLDAVGEPELWIYDYIDSWADPEWGGVSAGMVVAALEMIGNVSAITVRLNSPGGDYFEGVAIYNALVRHTAQVTMCVDALAASAASVIAMAGDRVVMGQGSQIMIHEARTGIFGGTADDFRSTAAMLDQTNDDIAGFYALRTGGDQAAWRAAVAAETWYTAVAAVEAGLADEIAGRPSVGQPAASAPAPPAPDEGDDEDETEPDDEPEDSLAPAAVAAAATQTPAPAGARPPAALPTAGFNLAALIEAAVRKDHA